MGHLIRKDIAEDMRLGLDEEIAKVKSTLAQIYVFANRQAAELNGQELTEDQVDKIEKDAPQVADLLFNSYE